MGIERQGLEEVILAKNGSDIGSKDRQSEGRRIYESEIYRGQRSKWVKCLRDKGLIDFWAVTDLSHGVTDLSHL
jgi:hypothetical protein